MIVQQILIDASSTATQLHKCCQSLLHKVDSLASRQVTSRLGCGTTPAWPLAIMHPSAGHIVAAFPAKQCCSCALEPRILMICANDDKKPQGRHQHLLIKRKQPGRCYRRSARPCRQRPVQQITRDASQTSCEVCGNWPRCDELSIHDVQADHDLDKPRTDPASAAGWHCDKFQCSACELGGWQPLAGHAHVTGLPARCSLPSAMTQLACMRHYGVDQPLLAFLLSCCLAVLLCCCFAISPSCCLALLLSCFVAVLPSCCLACVHAHCSANWWPFSAWWHTCGWPLTVQLWHRSGSTTRWCRQPMATSPASTHDLARCLQHRPLHWTELSCQPLQLLAASDSQVATARSALAPPLADSGRRLSILLAGLATVGQPGPPYTLRPRSVREGATEGSSASFFFLAASAAASSASCLRS